MTTVPRSDTSPAIQSAEEFTASPAYTKVSREVRTAPPRYRNEIGKYSVIRADSCARCGLCAEICRHGVHVRQDSYYRMLPPFDYRCIGRACAVTDFYCVEACPVGALLMTGNYELAEYTREGMVYTKERLLRE